MTRGTTVVVTVMGASTSKREAGEGFLEQQVKKGLHLVFESEVFYVDTSMLFQNCTVIGAIRLQNRDMIIHQFRTGKGTEQI